MKNTVTNEQTLSFFENEIEPDNSIYDHEYLELELISEDEYNRETELKFYGSSYGGSFENDIVEISLDEEYHWNCSALNAIHRVEQQVPKFSHKLLYNERGVPNELDLMNFDRSSFLDMNNLDKVMVNDEFELMMFRNFISTLFVIKNDVVDNTSTNIFELTANSLTVKLSVMRVTELVILELNGLCFEFKWDCCGNFIKDIMSLCIYTQLNTKIRGTNEDLNEEE